MKAWVLVEPPGLSTEAQLHLNEGGS
jgi:hypothetical protein